MTERVKIHLDEILSNNQSLFVIFGIFFALSVYLTQLMEKNSQNGVLQIGIISSLIIAVLIAYLIIKKIVITNMDPVPQESGHLTKFLTTSKSIIIQIVRSFYSIEVLIFIVAFIALILAIILLITSSKILPWILIPICYLAGIAVLLKTLVFIFDLSISGTIKGLVFFVLIVLIVYFYSAFTELSSNIFDPIKNYIGFFLLGYAHAIFALIILAILIVIVLSIKEAILKLKIKIIGK